MKNRTNLRGQLSKPALYLALVALALPGCKSETDTPSPVTDLPVPAPLQRTTPLFTPVAAPSAATPVNIVQVDGVALTTAELDDQVKRIVALEKRQYPNQDAFRNHVQELRNRIVQLFVRRTLLSNEAKRRNLSATKDEVNAEIDVIRKQIPEGQTLESAMAAQGMTDAEFRKDIREGLARKKLLDLLTSHIAKATDVDIEKFYKDNPDMFAVPEHVVVRHILIGCAESAEPEVRKKKKKEAEEHRKKLLAGADFTQMARQHSDDVEAKRSGGLLGPFTKKARILPEFRDASFKQEVDKIGPVIATAMGFHIIQVLEHNQESSTPLEEASKSIERRINGEREAPVIAELLEQLRDKAKIVVNDELARQTDGR